MTSLHAVPDRAAAYVLGIDPGPSTGIALVRYDRGWSGLAFQCNAAAAPLLLSLLLAHYGEAVARGGIEGFAPGTGPGARMRGGQVTRVLIEELAKTAAGHGVPLAARYAAVAKTWATDKRLREAGLYEITAKAPDARDAARHALFTAVHDCGWPDPLSNKAASR